MKIVVIGGSGLIGAKLTAVLGSRGHEVVAASRRSGVDAVTGAGLAAALAGAETLVDVANAPSFEDGAVLAFFETAGRQLLAAARAAGIAHHVALSVVGCDRLVQSGYMRAKLAQERLIAASGVPYTILRSTHFFEFVRGIVQSAADGDVVRLSPALIQPIAADDVAAALAGIAVAAPLSDIVEIAGPAPFPLDELARQWMAANGDMRRVVADVRARYFGAELNDRSLTPASPSRHGPTHFHDWLNHASPTTQRGVSS